MIWVGADDKGIGNGISFSSSSIKNFLFLMQAYFGGGGVFDGEGGLGEKVDCEGNLLGVGSGCVDGVSK